MSPLEAELLFARALLLLLLYAFLGAVAVLSWRELRLAAKRPFAKQATGTPEAGDASRPAASARLIVLAGGASERAPGTAFALTPVTRVGRAMDNDVVLRDPSLSAHHAMLARRDGAWWIEDLGSTNGSWVNGEAQAAGEPHIVRSGDLLQLGTLRLRLVDHDRR
jgi:hypothetical protein